MVRCFLPVDASGESGIRIGQNVDGMILELIALQMMLLDQQLFDVDPCC